MGCIKVAAFIVGLPLPLGSVDVVDVHTSGPRFNAEKAGV